MATRAEMSQRTRTALVAATRRLLSDGSYAATTLGDIAAEAGVTKGALYHHYRSKDELVQAVQEDTYDQVIAGSAGIAAEKLPAIKELRALLALHLDMLVEHRATLAATGAGRENLKKPGWEALQRKRDEIESFVTDAIARGIAEGHFSSDRDPRLSTYLLLGACYSTARWFDPEGRWSARDVANELASLAVNGLAGSSTHTGEAVSLSQLRLT